MVQAELRYVLFALNCLPSTNTWRPDLSVYEGEWRRGERHGEGRVEYRNHDVYMGQFKENDRHGYGLLQFADRGLVGLVQEFMYTGQVCLSLSSSSVLMFALN